jgi:thiol-disulfide isomerase/thioredoxin
MVRLGRVVTAALAAALLLAGCGTQEASSPTRQEGRSDGRSAESAAAAAKPLAFKAKTLDGAAFSGSSLAGKGAVLWFWAPWCAICRAEAPGVAEVARRFAGRVAFVGVAGRGEVAEMRRFADEAKIGFFPHVVDADGAIWESFGVTSQPAFAFVRPDGRVEVVLGSLPQADLEARAGELAA